MGFSTWYRRPYIEYNDGALYACSSTVAGPCGREPASGSLSDVRFTNQFTDTLYDMQVIASGDSTGGSGSCSAHISCITLVIDPAFLATNPGYKIVFGSNAKAAVCSPTVSAEVTGTQGTNGWYISKPTTLKWAVTGKPAPTKSGCGTVSVPDTTGITYTCTATNEVGSASDSITIKKDPVVPKVAINKPANNLTYTLHHKVPASYTCTDATSGSASCVGTVADGTDINTGTSGPQTFSVVATDNAGNTIMKTVNYTVN